MIYYNDKKHVYGETDYEMRFEAKNAALFTTGNGYYGVRGSFEEFGSLNVQGAFIRGLIDEIIEIPAIYVDNVYMRKYYIDELEAKKFEYQDSCINFADFLNIRFIIGDKTFYPWEGIIESWERYIDTKDGSLIRNVLWNDGEGNLTKLSYKRFASFSDDHLYLMQATLEKINHNLPCKITSGIDTFIKTNGQKKSKLKYQKNETNYNQYLFSIGEKYNYEVMVGIVNEFINAEKKDYHYKNGVYFEEAVGKDKKIGINKYIYSNATMDDVNISVYDKNTSGIKEILNSSFDKLYQEHLSVYKECFGMIDISLGDRSDDALLKYANYQTLISYNRNDDVHSLSAKNMTGEKYNQFVWWDAEIFQFPPILMTQKNAKNVLMYRYNRLEESKKNAQKEGYEGAKFAFCSSVKGDEKVWAYARHPHLQIHINSDIAYATLFYYKCTNDVEFMKKYGLELMMEINKYFVSRVTYDKKEETYNLLNVTGTDEHHPYVDNNSYTNYLVKYVFEESLKLVKEFNQKHIYDKKLINKMIDIKNNLKIGYKKGMIPQFDGYFDLSPTLEVTGSGAAKKFQMKESGLYHESQIIKQPDVMMLFTYINLPNLVADYKANWEYYEKMCESSSSLTYPVHAVAAIDNSEFEKFYDYWYKSVAIDIIDLHNEAHLGLHAAAMAGGWVGIFRGLFGFKPELEYLEVAPKYFEKWNQVTINFYYQEKKVTATLEKESLEIISKGKIKIKYKDAYHLHENYSKFKI